MYHMQNNERDKYSKFRRYDMIRENYTSPMLNTDLLLCSSPASPSLIFRPCPPIATNYT